MKQFMPRDFKPGDKVRFFGMKAEVVDGFYPPEMWSAWAVPIDVKNSGFITIAHVDNLKSRGKKK